MFNAEKLLGKVLSGAMGGTGKNRKKRDLFDSVGAQLTSGKGLLTVIGLGIGAYEILKSKQTIPRQTSSGQIPPALNMPPPSHLAASLPVAAAPPPLPVQGDVAGKKQPLPFPGGEQALARRFIQIMIASAYADGRMDELEEKQILARMQDQGLSREEKNYILAELHSPKSVEVLSEGLSTPQLRQLAYTLASSTVVVDSGAERQWLDSLAVALFISPSMQRFIEEQLGD
ncbi:MAG: tellurite resistance TerB family protein [Proteobacteria bacterium]|nr:tellurite resistance TerB family protein [Pseudomonadota bacterium]MBU1418720.1 tellurite resistance TerB family protein [Pseudomonadota bacterium]MBU1454466.1 tellurite resistance TerB family protein [Pseudomonadota bacterium]